ncbi:MAG TPA: SulP family inorganic anion transporter, partial [Microthrixaceae bacterium]|nr:SulP family inorganic anion transporter [Microthrixaceae bacterium]
MTGSIPVFRAVHPRERPWAQLLAGVTLTAISVPEVLGFARIAGMPIQTGLITMIAPVVAYVAFCSSQHLVVGADSATAAILA